MNVYVLYMYILIGHVGRVFAKWPGRPGFDPRTCYTKDTKMVLDASLLNIQHYKIRIKGKVKQFREESGTLSYTSVL